MRWWTSSGGRMWLRCLALMCGWLAAYDTPDDIQTPGSRSAVRVAGRPTAAGRAATKRENKELNGQRWERKKGRKQET